MVEIIKRDGRPAEYNPLKVENAILKAFREVNGDVNENSKQTAKQIQQCVTERVTAGEIQHVEEIQDVIEQQLMAAGAYNIAKAYILYRNERTKVRERNSRLVQKVMVRADAKIDERSNANVDEKSFSGREKEASADIGKTIALEFGGLSEEVANAHKEMLVYQHDLEKAIYGVHNCLQLNFQEIFNYGFRTRNGDVRPPSNFSTACQLVAVAFQCESQVQFGGVGSIHLDYDLAPFVRKSFRKHMKDYYTDVAMYKDDEAESMLRDHEPIELDNHELQKSGVTQGAYRYAVKQLEKEGRQAAQGLYHNLNTLESRQGSQVPFTSINLGRDTSTEGRLVTKWIMEASIDGIGKYHQTSIFPISIFQYKAGNNANPDDVNYDMKQLALASMSKRIYPNWANCDWSQAHEDENNPDTYFSTINKTVA